MKILLEGDSWAYSFHVDAACGARSKGLFKHKSLQKYNGAEESLKDILAGLGHEVILSAKCGSSNRFVLDRLCKIKETDIDLIVVFQTCPIRDLNDSFIAKSEVYEKNLKDKVSHLTPSQFDEFVQDLAYKYYYNLHNIINSKFNNVPTILLGGNSRVDGKTFKRFVNEHPNTSLKSPCESILEMLYNRISMDTYPMPHTLDFHSTELTFANWIHNVDDTWNHDLIDYIYEQKGLSNSVVQYYSFLTWPDSGHLNRAGMLYLVDEILCWADEYLETGNA